MGRMITLEADGPFDAYVVEPEGVQPPRGGLVVIHEIWGLVDHIKDVADRFAREGYVVVAPDLLSRAGVHPQLGQQLQEIMFSPDERVRTEGQPRLRTAFAPAQAPAFAAWAITALRGALDWLEQQPGVGNQVAVTGFCFGGTYSFALAAEDPRIRAAVPFYGSPPEVTETDKITAPILAFYGDQDERLITSLPDVQQEMKRGGIDFTSHVYAGVGHAFFNDTNARTYDAAAAADAWTRTLGLPRPGHRFAGHRRPDPGQRGRDGLHAADHDLTARLDRRCAGAGVPPESGRAHLDGPCRGTARARARAPRAGARRLRADDAPPAGRVPVDRPGARGRRGRGRSTSTASGTCGCAPRIRSRPTGRPARCC